MRAEAERALGGVGAAEASYRAAIDGARARGARLLELRATVGLCRLWLADGRRVEARASLQSIVSTFTEGLDTTDLPEALALLTSALAGGQESARAAAAS